MRKALALTAVLSLGLAVFWWWPDEPAKPVAATPRRASTVLTQPVMVSKGTGSITGVVDAPGAIVTATVPDPELYPCDCEDHCGRDVLSCTSQEASELLDQRRSEEIPVARTTAAADGSFTLAGLEPGRVQLWADAPRLGTALLADVEVGATGVALSLKAGGGVTFKGRALFDRKHAAVGAHVAAVRVDHRRWFDGVVAADGRFELGPLPPGKYVIAGGAPGRLPAHVASDTASLVLLLSLPVELGGTVTRGGRAALGLTVHLEGEHRERSISSGSDGAFRFPGLKLGHYRVTVRDGQLGALARVNLAGDDMSVKLEFAPVSQLSGTVRDVHGSPIEGATVIAQGGEVVGVNTGADGTFALTLFSSKLVGVTASADGFVESRVDAVDLDRPDVRVDFTLQPEATVSGVVVDGAGTPVPGALIHGDGAVFGLSPLVESDAHGAFVVHGLAPGDYVLRATHNDWAPGELAVTAPSSQVRLQLTRGVELNGQVVTHAGAPVAAARVSCDGERFDLAHETTTAADGRFTVRGLEEGITTVEVAAAQQRAARVIQVRPGKNELRIELEEQLSITGVLLAAGGAAVPDVEVVATPVQVDVGTSAGRDFTDEHGAFEIERLTAGDYRLTAVAGQSYAQHLARAGDRDVRLQAPPVTEIHGRVVGPGGAPVKSFNVDRKSFEGETGEFTLHTQAREDGGSRELRFDADGFKALRRRVALAGQPRIELGDVELEQGAQLEVEVVTTRGEPIEGAAVAAFPGRARRGITSAAGVVHLTGLEVPGTIIVEHERYVSRTAGYSERDSSLKVELSRDSRVVVQVKTAAGRPAIATVSTARVGGGSSSMVLSTDAAGEVELKGLEPGRHQICASSRVPNGYVGVGALVELREGAGQSISLRLPATTVALEIDASMPPGQWRSGEAVLLLAALGEPRSGADLDWFLSGALDHTSMDLGRPGRFVFDAVAPGSYRIAITAYSDEGAVRFSAPIEVLAQPRQVVRVPAPATTF